MQNLLPYMLLLFTCPVVIFRLVVNVLTNVGCSVCVEIAAKMRYLVPNTVPVPLSFTGLWVLAVCLDRSRGWQAAPSLESGRRYFQGLCPP